MINSLLKGLAFVNLDYAIKGSKFGREKGTRPRVKTSLLAGRYWTVKRTLPSHNARTLGLLTFSWVG
ncbi:hypothetical protein K6U06_18335 [Acidiferrimicrobium sp. IK]|uniref:hypothetical protein n=1 Tax=Acidiferrimicrobium sp. IK TaxID=2871700 RepID=UPI0021CB2DA6|nr:hypothetical protein [Acidiferrimicrobium sp. IK]MCU4186331.1 hypothetical protein [Acidiferrimicrobium sp. IK]